jgi:hypothetical protein
LSRIVWRLLISAFVIFHLTAVLVWMVPNCVIKQRLTLPLAFYMLPTGNWQYWGMFAPNPLRDTITLEALVVDAKGILHVFDFPKEQDFPKWKSFFLFRHSKYAANFALKDDFASSREFGARYAVRQLKIPADSFPVEVQIVFQVRPTPPPGGPPPDPMSPTIISTIESYRFPTLEEVLP